MSGECRLIVFLSLLALCIVRGGAQDCNQAVTCSECVQRVNCAWCSDINITSTLRSRCAEVSTVNNSGCLFPEILSGSVGARTVPDNPSQNPIDLRNIKLELRVGEPQIFPVRVTALRNLPLDLYILMDLSSSMGTVLDNIKSVSGEITGRISDITNNSRLAFGSYNDKRLFPFTGDVADAYAYRHSINFTDDVTAFSDALQSAAVTMNLDFAENLFEALAQVVACEDVLQWRSRTVTQVARLVLVLTDAGFHYAGEGLFGGILTPYLGTCNLQPGQEPIEFMQYDTLDYPSVGQIADLLQAQDVNVIFAVTQGNIPTYQTLASLTNGRARVSELQADSASGAAEGILDIIETSYRQLIRNIILQQSADTESPQFTVNIVPTCPSGSSVNANGQGCDRVELEDFVDFMVSVTLNSCTGLEDGQARILKLDAGTFGSFTVNVTGVCDCPCEDIKDENSARCSGNGDFTCGVCECNDGYCGPNCNLTFAGPSSAESCPVGPSVFGNQLCSGRGRCDCRCFCNQDTFGDACECDTFSDNCKANPTDTQVCSGRGTCCSQSCTCDNSPLGNPYRSTSTLNACQCEPAEEICDYNGAVCNNRGSCDCRGCRCLSEWVGSFCQIYTATRCADAIDTQCIMDCREAGAPDNCEAEGSCTENRPTLFVDMATINTNTDQAVEDYARGVLGLDYRLVRGGGSSARCETILGNGCTSEYYILENSNTSNIAIVVVREEDCPTAEPYVPPIPIWSIALIIVAALIILGIIIIIIIKIIFIILDYTEVKRWQKEAREADFSKNQNPLYQSPEMQYTNVAYGKAI